MLSIEENKTQNTIEKKKNKKKNCKKKKGESYFRKIKKLKKEKIKN